MKKFKKYKYIRFFCFFSMRSFYILIWWFSVFCMSFFLYLINQDYISMFCGVFSFCLFINDSVILWHVFKEVSLRQLNLNKYCDLVDKVKFKLWNEINVNEDPDAKYVRSLKDNNAISEEDLYYFLLLAYKTYTGKVLNDNSNINPVFFNHFVQLVRDRDKYLMK